MISVGLMPSDTGRPGGKLTGQQMSDYLIEDGAFQRAFRQITASELQNLRLPFKNTTALVLEPSSGNPDDSEEENDQSATKPNAGKSGKKSKYVCSCGNNLWGKGGLSFKCNVCLDDFIESE